VETFSKIRASTINLAIKTKKLVNQFIILVLSGIHQFWRFSVPGYYVLWDIFVIKEIDTNTDRGYFIVVFATTKYVHLPEK
jgi:hypothetical protein